MNAKLLILPIVVFLSIDGYSQDGSLSTTRKGNRLMKKDKYYEAEKEYRKVLEEKPFMTEANFNLGNSLYNQGKYDEAATQYEESMISAKEDSDNANSFYNLGNSYYNQEQYDMAVEAYKQALRINPDDQDARYNLAMAQQKLKQNGGQGGSQQQNDNNQEQNQDQQQNQSQQNQQEQQNQQQDQQQNQQQEQQQGQQQDQQQQQGQESEKRDGQEAQQMQISKEDAERMLEALKNNEQKTIRKVQDSKSQGQRVKVDKDW